MTYDNWLAALEAVCAAATRGPWIANKRHSDPNALWRIESRDEHGEVNDGWIIAQCEGSDDKANARHIAAARTAFPLVLAALRETRAALEGLVDHSDRCKGHRGCAEDAAPLFIEARRVLAAPPPEGP